MTDFAATIHRNIDALPAGAEHDALLAGAAQLQTTIADRVDANQVATLARDLAGQRLAVYPVALSPKQPPNLARGQQLYAEQCAGRSEEHTSELQSLMRITDAVFCLKTKNRLSSLT